jgi:hypothetical protein
MLKGPIDWRSCADTVHNSGSTRRSSKATLTLTSKLSSLCLFLLRCGLQRFLQSAVVSTLVDKGEHVARPTTTQRRIRLKGGDLNDIQLFDANLHFELSSNRSLLLVRIRMLYICSIDRILLAIVDPIMASPHLPL